MLLLVDDLRERGSRLLLLSEVLVDDLLERERNSWLWFGVARDGSFVVERCCACLNDRGTTGCGSVAFMASSSSWSVGKCSSVGVYIVVGRLERLSALISKCRISAT